MTEELIRHKHADLIHGWAEGAKIQYSLGNNWYNTEKPEWNINTEYRIKPKKNVIKYKTALRKYNGKHIVDSYPEHSFDAVEKLEGFLRWITEEQTVEIDV